MHAAAFFAADGDAVVHRVGGAGNRRTAGQERRTTPRVRTGLAVGTREDFAGLDALGSKLAAAANGATSVRQLDGVAPLRPRW